MPNQPNRQDAPLGNLLMDASSDLTIRVLSRLTTRKKNDMNIVYLASTKGVELRGYKDLSAAVDAITDDIELEEEELEKEVRDYVLQ